MTELFNNLAALDMSIRAAGVVIVWIAGMGLTVRSLGY